MLNLPNALQVAQICSKYFLVEEIGEMTAPEFISSLVEKLEEEELNYFLKLVDKGGAQEFMDGVTILLLDSSILELIIYYQGLGK